tara:strand:+ start:1222 stop:1431 length:210 start_codon:yes stop_codon:yes gene_type:complete
MKKPNPKNGNQTFTDQGRQFAAEKIRETKSGWPEWKKNRFEAKMTELNRRFDEAGMEVKFRQVKIEYLK